jgi:hypothetical protein
MRTHRLVSTITMLIAIGLAAPSTAQSPERTRERLRKVPTPEKLIIVDPKAKQEVSNERLIILRDLDAAFAIGRRTRATIHLMPGTYHSKVQTITTSIEGIGSKRPKIIFAQHTAFNNVRLKNIEAQFEHGSQHFFGGKVRLDHVKFVGTYKASRRRTSMIKRLWNGIAGIRSAHAAPQKGAGKAPGTEGNKEVINEFFNNKMTGVTQCNEINITGSTFLYVTVGVACEIVKISNSEFNGSNTAVITRKGSIIGGNTFLHNTTALHLSKIHSNGQLQIILGIVPTDQFEQSSPGWDSGPYNLSVYGGAFQYNSNSILIETGKLTISKDFSPSESDAYAMFLDNYGTAIAITGGNDHSIYHARFVGNKIGIRSTSPSLKVHAAYFEENSTAGIQHNGPIEVVSSVFKKNVIGVETLNIQGNVTASFLENNFFENTVGIKLLSNDLATLDKNIFLKNGRGFVRRYGSTTLTKNYFIENDIGAEFQHGTHAKLDGNFILRNAIYGLFFTDDTQSTGTFNFQNPESAVGPTANIHNNYFEDNNISAFIEAGSPVFGYPGKNIFSTVKACHIFNGKLQGSIQAYNNFWSQGVATPLEAMISYDQIPEGSMPGCGPAADIANLKVDSQSATTFHTNVDICEFVPQYCKFQAEGVQLKKKNIKTFDVDKQPFLPPGSQNFPGTPKL